MDDRLKNSQVNTRSVSRTGSLLGSFKMGDSVLGTGKNRKIRNLELKNLQLVDKDAYRKQEECQVCFITFGKLNRQHHCRVCANAVCSDCSASCINKERACDVCIYSRTNEGVEREMLKNNILEQLKGIAIIYAQNKLKVEQELRTASEEAGDQAQMQAFLDSANRRIEQLQAKIEAVKAQTLEVEQQTQQIRSSN